MAANRYLDRAANATRSSKRVALRDSADYVELVRDVAAMANSGGGVIVLDGVAERPAVRGGGRRGRTECAAGVHADGAPGWRSRRVRAGRPLLPPRSQERGGDRRGRPRLHPP